MATPLNNSLLKGFELLSLFSKDQKEISSALVEQKTGMNRATAHRFLVTLEAAGAISTIRRGYYTLGPKIAELGALDEEQNTLGTAIQPILNDLSQSLNESVMACRLTPHGPSCIAVARSNQPISVNIGVGTLLPMLKSAQGQLWLANMSKPDRAKHIQAASIANSNGARLTSPDDPTFDEIRENGFAVNLGANEPDIAAISVPVFDANKRMRLSISAFGLLSRFDDKTIRAGKGALLNAAREISAIVSSD